jgi:hypothetical protein
MRWDMAAHLQHDLGPGSEPQGARVAAAAGAVYEHGNGAAKRRQASRSERLTPDVEQVAERRPALVVDDSARVERPDAGTAVRTHDAAEPALRMPDSDRGRNDHDTPPGEQFDMDARSSLQRRGTADEPRRGRPRGRLIQMSGAHGRRHRAGDERGRGDGHGAEVHRLQAMRILFCLLACVLASGIAASVARADGDPASDYLVGQQAFLSYDAKIPLPFQRRLVAAVASANRQGFPIRVALIWSSYDLGSVPELFGKPRTYARFLDAEDSKCWWGAGCSSGRFKATTRLLVVMPNGLGFAQWKHNPAAGYRILKGIGVTRTPAGLASAATTAVVKLAAASGVKVSTKGRTAVPPHVGGSSGAYRIEILVAVLVALLVGAAARLLIRRRASRSAFR